MTGESRRYDPEEMKQFGLNPLDGEDIGKWFACESELTDQSPVDYSKDGFAFGNTPGQASETVVESDL